MVPLSTKSAFVFCQHQITPARAKAATTAAAAATAGASEKPPSSSKHWQSVTVPARKSPRLDERAVHYTQTMWERWENSETWWKQKTVQMGNFVLERIPYQEYAVKRIPSKRAVLRKIHKGYHNHQNLEESTTHVSHSELEKIKQSPSPEGTTPALMVHSINVQYPSCIMTEAQSLQVLSQLATTGVRNHWKYMWVALALTPLTAPMSLLPVLPNFPGYYLLYRAWSHWKAWEGAKHLAYLVDEDHLDFTACTALNAAYKGVPQFTGDKEKEESIVLSPQIIEKVVTGVEATHELAAELARAVRQVEKKIAEHQPARPQDL